MAEQKPVDIAGTWRIDVDFLAGRSTHALTLEQDGETLSGRYRFGFTSGEVEGVVRGDEIDLRTSFRHEGRGVSYRYTGQVTDDTMRGTVDLGEYWTAEWTGARA